MIVEKIWNDVQLSRWLKMIDAKDIFGFLIKFYFLIFAASYDKSADRNS